MLQNLLEQLRNAGTGSKVIAGLVLVAVVSIASTAAVVARKPHFELLYGGLTASESAEVQRALATAGIPFDQSQPPGPFIVYVDRAQRYEALQAVAAAGALSRPEGGIQGSTEGMGSVFLSAAERSQQTLKRRWQEQEKVLEAFDFVSDARVTTTTDGGGPFGGPGRTTGSVVVRLSQPGTLTKSQARSLANQVQFGLGIDPADLNISDQSGNSLYDGTQHESAGPGSGDWLEKKVQFERDLEERANATLAEILGERKARVNVVSTWSHDILSKVAEKPSTEKGIIISQTEATTATPQGAPATAGGPAGPGSNTDEFTNGSAGGVTAAGAGSEAVAETSDKSSQYYVPRETTRSVTLTPRLEQLSVSLFLDESLTERRADLESSVKASVGFLETRGDVFSSTLLTFATGKGEGEESEGGEGATEETSGEPNPMMEMLLERGVELLSAVAFLFILMKSLKGANKGSEETAATPEAPAMTEDDEMMERLAQAQIEELVKSEPERVGQILSAWAGEEKATAGS